MYFIENVLVQDEVVQEHFACNLAACKGACCWEGDYGAPLEDAELATLESVYPEVRPYLNQESIARIEAEGLYTYTEDNKQWATALMPNGACVYLTFEKNGVAKCGIERAYYDNKIDWVKPISCHLYPVRIKHNPTQGFDTLKYDRWDICSAACSKGEKEEIRIYEFVKSALVRKYGQDWYDELVAAVEHHK